MKKVSKQMRKMEVARETPAAAAIASTETFSKPNWPKRSKATRTISERVCSFCLPRRDVVLSFTNWTLVY